MPLKMTLADRLIFQPVSRPFGEPERGTDRVPLKRDTAGTGCRVNSVQAEHEADSVPRFRNIGVIEFRSGYEKSEHDACRVLPS
jgi:hypothetical protein